MSVAKVCIVCNKEFSVPLSRAETAKTCSQKCRGVLIAKGYQEQRAAHRCKWCDAEFFSPKSHAHRRIHCSAKCAVAAQVGTYYGQKSPDGNTTMHSAGYVLERAVEHPFSVGGEVMQHRLVMEQWMREDASSHHFLVDIEGVKYLRREIHVHHRNEVKADNQRNNLLACTAATHRDIHDGRPVMKGTAWPESGDEIEAVQRTFTRVCGICKKSFTAKRSDVLRGGGKYCSRECRTKAATGKPLNRKA